MTGFLPFAAPVRAVALAFCAFEDDAIAHLADDGRAHLYSDHAEAVACAVRDGLEPYELGTYGYVLGLAHDLGKITQEWQDGIRRIQQGQAEG